LPQHGTIVDVGNGLGAQDPLIADIAHPRTLIAVNITESQLRAGRARLQHARAKPVVADAVRLPFKDDSVDGLISVEAAFHFSSRARFFSEVSRVLRSGGVLAMSDVATKRLPRRPDELAAGLLTARIWALRWQAAMTVEDIVRAALSNGLTDVRIQPCGERVIAPALNFLTDRLQDAEEAPPLQRSAAEAVLASWRLLWRRGIIDYIMLTARAP
jgi:ubiquinone/menaquinone biosynthesis C-methylase UbiE